MSVMLTFWELQIHHYALLRHCFDITCIEIVFFFILILCDSVLYILLFRQILLKNKKNFSLYVPILVSFSIHIMLTFISQNGSRH